MSRNSKIDTSVKDLRYTEDPYHSGFGARGLGTATPHRYLEVERATSAEGEDTYLVYRPSAMRRAARRSSRAGGGVRGLCSDDLLEGEVVEVSPQATVRFAIRMLRYREWEQRKVHREPFDPHNP